jgi:hypothetical protein
LLLPAVLSGRAEFFFVDIAVTEAKVQAILGAKMTPGNRDEEG